MTNKKALIFIYLGYNTRDGDIYVPQQKQLGRNPENTQSGLSLKKMYELWKQRSKNYTHLLLILDCPRSGDWVEDLKLINDPSIYVQYSAPVPSPKRSGKHKH